MTSAVGPEQSTVAAQDGQTTWRLDLAAEPAGRFLDLLVGAQGPRLHGGQVERAANVELRLGAVGKIQRQEGVQAAEIRHLRFPAVAGHERQFALRPARLAGPHVGGNEALTVQLQFVAGRDVGKGRHALRGLDLAAARQGVLARGVRQPAVGPVFEPDIPLVPVAFVKPQLNAADHVEALAVVLAGRPQAQGRIVFQHVGHFADAPDRIGILQQGAAASAADRHDRSRGRELDRGAALRTQNLLHGALAGEFLQHFRLGRVVVGGGDQPLVQQVL
ncbi:hypothetical protein G6F65_016994 [Rhizopus arrhizus]|nr:hypothetical protein G6F65_016994 [Rhizopus arrhizus]